MLDQNIVIDEKRGIKISLGVLIHFIITVAIIVTGYLSIKQELFAATEQGKRNESQIEAIQGVMNSARLDLRGLDAKFDQFIQSYDRDMNKYLRDPKDWRSK